MRRWNANKGGQLWRTKTAPQDVADSSERPLEGIAHDQDLLDCILPDDIFSIKVDAVDIERN